MSTANRFDDKEFLVNGRKIEEVPMKESLLHYDDKILRSLCHTVMCQAIQDWIMLNPKGEKKDNIVKNDVMIYRRELLNFFNSTFCGDLLLLIAPNVPQEMAIEHMTKYPLKKQALGWGRGSKSKNR